MEIIEGKNYLTITDLVDRIKISRPTALRYIKQGKLAAVGVRGKWYITEESFKEFMTPRKTPPAFTNRKANVANRGVRKKKDS